jgi:hypothetical protein
MHPASNETPTLRWIQKIKPGMACVKSVKTQAVQRNQDRHKLPQWERVAAARRATIRVSFFRPDFSQIAGYNGMPHPVQWHGVLIAASAHW